MDKTILVLDRFFSQRTLAAIRTDMKRGTYKVRPNDYGGEYSLRRSPYAKLVARKLAAQLGRDVEWDWGTGLGTYRRISPRDLASARENINVHCDPYKAIAVAYLNPAASCHGGTRLYRHDMTGLRGLHDLEAVAKVLAKYTWSPADLVAQLMKDARDPKRWTMVGAVEMIENRVFVFDGRLFHSHYIDAAAARKAREPRYTLALYTKSVRARPRAR